MMEGDNMIYAYAVSERWKTSMEAKGRVELDPTEIVHLDVRLDF